MKRGSKMGKRDKNQSSIYPTNQTFYFYNSIITTTRKAGVEQFSFFYRVGVEQKYIPYMLNIFLEGTYMI